MKALVRLSAAEKYCIVKNFKANFCTWRTDCKEHEG